MSLTDSSFFFVFFPVSLLACLLKPGYRKYVLLIISLFFYACGSPRYFLLFLLLVVLDVILAYILQETMGGDRSFSLAGSGLVCTTALL